MYDAINNTSPLLYLYRIDALEWLPGVFKKIWIPQAVVIELEEGRKRGFDVPDPNQIPWLDVVDPQTVPMEWLTLDLGMGELAVMALAFKEQRLIERIAPFLKRLATSGMWISNDIRQRVLMLAGEGNGSR